MPPPVRCTRDPSAAALPPDRPCVLVVEDDAITRMAAVAMPDAAGYAVIEADGGLAAVRALETGADIRAVVTDIDLASGLDGIRLAARVRQCWPEVAILMVSGKVRPVPGDAPERVRFFEKPYLEREVLAELGQLMRA